MKTSLRVVISLSLAAALFSFWCFVFPTTRALLPFSTAPRVVLSDYDDGLDPSNENVFWWSQISDIHISNANKSRESHLKYFVSSILPVLKPEFVLVTGDLVHSGNAGGPHLRSAQAETEWQSYRDILSSHNVGNDSFWFDLPGNHDRFSVSHKGADTDFYSTHSVTGVHRKGALAYTYIKQVGLHNYTFLGIDASLEPGLAAPFNAFGSVTTSILDAVEHQLEMVVSSFGSRHLIVFGHYPLVTLHSARTSVSHLTLRDLFSKFHVTAYLCGHLHAVLGLNLYGRHVGSSTPSLAQGDTVTVKSSELLELELLDMKENRFARIMAYDNGLFSFFDFDIADRPWPLILITNPKDCRFILSQEPTSRISTSSQVRMLIFSDTPIISVEVFIDDTKLDHTVTHLNGPLYSIPWDPSRYESTGESIHSITVSAVNKAKQQRTIHQSFSIDGTVCNRHTMGSFILLSRLPLVLQSAYYLLHCGSIALFLLLPWWYIKRFTSNEEINRWKIRETSLLYTYCNACQHRLALSDSLLWAFFRMYRLGCIELVLRRDLFNALLISGVYLLVGPWFIGEFIVGEYGAFFLWGFWLFDGRFLITLETYFYSFFIFLRFWLPQVLYCILPVSNVCVPSAEVKQCERCTKSSGQPSWQILSRIESIVFATIISMSTRSSILVRGTLLCVFVFNLRFIASMMNNYGLAVGLISPGFSWLLALQMWTVWQCYRFDAKVAPAEIAKKS